MRKIIPILFFLALPLTLCAESLEVFYDYAIFKYNEDSSLVEIYYSLLDTTLSYKPIDNNLLDSRIRFEAKFTHQQKATIEKYNWDYHQTKQLKDSNLIYSLFGVEQIFIPKGNYKTEIICYDENNQSNKFNFKNDIRVFTYGDEKSSLSMIEFAGIIEKKSEQTQNWNEMFRKGDMFILPNPTLEYTSESPNLQFYFETYNTQKKDRSLQYLLTILDGAKRDVFKTFIKVWSEVTDHGRTLSVPLDLLPTGVYYAQLALIRLEEQILVLDQVTKKFYFYNQFIPPQLTANFSEDQLFEMSEFATMTTDKVEYEFRKASIIARPIEIDQWEKLNELGGKQRFLYRFWSMRDEDTTTVLNEAKMHFDDNVAYANTYYTYGKNKDGWNTDRGRILLKYGNPTQVDRYPAIGTDRAYEEWFFAEIQGGVKFQFVDVMGFGNYILVNSNALGEIKNSRWYEDYVKNQKASGSQDEDIYNINK